MTPAVSQSRFSKINNLCKDSFPEEGAQIRFDHQIDGESEVFGDVLLDPDEFQQTNFRRAFKVHQNIQIAVAVLIAPNIGSEYTDLLDAQPGEVGLLTHEKGRDFFQGCHRCFYYTVSWAGLCRLALRCRDSA